MHKPATKKYLIPMLLCIMLSCSQEKPSEILSEAQIVAVLIDLHLAKAMIRHNHYSKDSTALFHQKNVAAIYKSHGINYEVFEKSFAYYLEDIKKMKCIYEAVIDSPSAQKEHLEMKRYEKYSMERR